MATGNNAPDLPLHELCNHLKVSQDLVTLGVRGEDKFQTRRIESPHKEPVRCALELEPGKNQRAATRSRQ